MTTPLIGITTYRGTNKQGHPLIMLMEAYVQALVHAGGTPVLIPLGLPDDQVSDLVSRLDGILFSGGGDIEPTQYGGDSHPKVSGVDVDRDRVEFQLCSEAVKRRLPFLGICRGIQVINVAQGGTLYPHVPDQLPGDFHPPHDETKPRDSLAHEVQVKPGSRLAAILGRSNLRVNSMHHQGIARLAPGFTANAHAPDGLIEAIELDDHPFGLAVQWHPEWLTAYEPTRALFRAFVEAASQ